MGGNKRSGRKPKNPNEHANQAVTAWMTADKKALIERAASMDNVPAGRWLGNVGVERARAKLGLS